MFESFSSEVHIFSFLYFYSSLDLSELAKAAKKKLQTVCMEIILFQNNEN